MKNNSVADYLALHRGMPPHQLHVDPVFGDSRFAISLTDFPNCIGQGATVSDAIERLKILMPSFLENMVAAGVQLPMERPAATISEINVSTSQT